MIADVAGAIELLGVAYRRWEERPDDDTAAEVRALHADLQDVAASIEQAIESSRVPTDGL